MILQTSSKDRVCCFDVHKSRAQAGLLTRFVKLQAHANQVRSPLSIWQGLTRLTCVCISISLTRHTWLMTLELTTLTIYHTLHTLHTRNTLPTLLTLPTLPTLPHYTLVYDFYTLYYSIYTFYIYIYITHIMLYTIYAIYQKHFICDTSSLPLTLWAQQKIESKVLLEHLVRLQQSSAKTVPKLLHEPCQRLAAQWTIITIITYVMCEL